MSGSLAWKKILVGVDGSEYAEKALKQAIEIAKRFSAEITVINVYQEPLAGHELSHRILENAKVFLEDAEVKHKLVSVLSPNASKVITDKAKDEKFDLIVIGSRGVGAVQAFVLGSVCNRISCESPVTVLIVK